MDPPGPIKPTRRRVPPVCLRLGAELVDSGQADRMRLAWTLWETRIRSGGRRGGVRRSDGPLHCPIWPSGRPIARPLASSRVRVSLPKAGAEIGPEASSMAFLRARAGTPSCPDHAGEPGSRDLRVLTWISACSQWRTVSYAPQSSPGHRRLPACAMAVMLLAGPLVAQEERRLEAPADLHRDPPELPWFRCRPAPPSRPARRTGTGAR